MGSVVRWVFKGEYFYCLYLFLVVCVLYFFTSEYPQVQHDNVVVSGDPFTYTLTWFRVWGLSYGSYWKTLFHALSGKASAYQLQASLIAFLSPFIKSNPVSIAWINFFSLYIALLMIYRLGLWFLRDSLKAIVFACCYLLFPFHYSQHAAGLYILMLDCSFYHFLVAGVAAFFLYILEPRSLLNAVLAAALLSLSLWGRGNSIVYLIIACAVPFLILLKELVVSNSFREFRVPFFIFCFVFCVLGISFLFVQWRFVSGYYSPHKNLVLDIPFDFKKIVVLLLSFPGIYFRNEAESQHALIPKAISLVSHLIALVIGSYAVFKTNRNFGERVIQWTGVWVYFVTLFVISAFFHNIIVGVDDIILVKSAFFLMMIGLFFLLSPILFGLLRRVNFSFLVLGCLFLFIPVYGIHWTKKNYAFSQGVNVTSVKEVREVASKFSELFPNESVAFLWWDLYNPPVINYYRMIENLNELPYSSKRVSKTHFYNYNDFHCLWTPSASISESVLLKEIASAFAEADVVVMPKRMSSYSRYDPYPIYQHKHLVAEAFADPSIPFYKVRMTLNNNGTELLVLERALDEKEALPKNYFK